MHVRDILSTVGCSASWEDIMSTVGVILSTVGDAQYHGGYHDARGGYDEYHEVFSTVVYSNNKRFPITELNSPHGTHDIPTYIMLSPRPPRY